MLSTLTAWARRLRREVATVTLALRDPRTPWVARGLGAIVVAYAFSPVDLVPDFVPVLGMLDDLLLVPLGIWLVLKLIPAEVLEDARASAEEQLRNPKPVSRAGALGVVAIWVGVSALAAWIGWRAWRA
jgi:uncharacterized membrane protein YkvA (DUF1232 family)